MVRAKKCASSRGRRRVSVVPGIHQLHKKVIELNGGRQTYKTTHMRAVIASGGAPTPGIGLKRARVMHETMQKAAEALGTTLDEIAKQIAPLMPGKRAPKPDEDMGYCIASGETINAVLRGGDTHVLTYRDREFSDQLFPVALQKLIDTHPHVADAVRNPELWSARSDDQRARIRRAIETITSHTTAEATPAHATARVGVTGRATPYGHIQITEKVMLMYEATFERVDGTRVVGRGDTPGGAISEILRELAKS